MEGRRSIPPDQRPLLAERAARRRHRKAPEHCTSRPAIMALLTFVALTYVCYAYATLLPSVPARASHVSRESETQVPALGVPRSMQQSWAMYSPYFAVEQYQAPPHGCKIDQVRFPASNACFLSWASRSCRRTGSPSSGSPLLLLA